MGAAAVGHATDIAGCVQDDFRGGFLAIFVPAGEVMQRGVATASLEPAPLPPHYVENVGEGDLRVIAVELKRG